MSNYVSNIAFRNSFLLPEVNFTYGITRSNNYTILAIFIFFVSILGIPFYYTGFILRDFFKSDGLPAANKSDNKLHTLRLILLLSVLTVITAISFTFVFMILKSPEIFISYLYFRAVTKIIILSNHDLFVTLLHQITFYLLSGGFLKLLLSDVKFFDMFI